MTNRLKNTTEQHPQNSISNNVFLFPFHRARREKYHKLVSYLLFLKEEDNSLFGQIKCSFFENDEYLLKAFLEHKFPLENAKKQYRAIYEYFHILRLPKNELEYRKMKYEFEYLNSIR